MSTTPSRGGWPRPRPRARSKSSSPTPTRRARPAAPATPARSPGRHGPADLVLTAGDPGGITRRLGHCAQCALAGGWPDLGVPRGLARVAGPMLFHIASRTAWENPPYEPASLAEEGFVHFSTADQYLRVADARFKGVEDLVLLVVDENQTGPWKYEDSDNPGDLSPPLYGPLDPHAVVEARIFEV